MDEKTKQKTFIRKKRHETNERKPYKEGMFQESNLLPIQIEIILHAWFSERKCMQLMISVKHFVCVLSYV